MKRKILSITLAVVAVGGPALPVSLPTTGPESVGLSTERLRRLTISLKAEVDEGRLPGAVVAVARKGQLAYFEAVGFRDPEAKVPMPKDAIFSIASMTKPMVSVAIMALEEDGRLRLSDPIGKYLPGLANMRVAAETGKTPFCLIPPYSRRAHRASAPIGIALIVMPYVETPALNLALLVLGISLPSVIYVLSPAIVSEFTPVSQRGAMLTIITAVATSAGLLAPYVMGRIIESGTTPSEGFHQGFLICGVVSLIGGLIGMAFLRPNAEAARFAAADAAAAARRDPLINAELAL